MCSDGFQANNEHYLLQQVFVLPHRILHLKMVFFLHELGFMFDYDLLDGLGLVKMTLHCLILLVLLINVVWLYVSCMLMYILHVK